MLICEINRRKELDSFRSVYESHFAALALHSEEH